MSQVNLPSVPAISTPVDCEALFSKAKKDFLSALPRDEQTRFKPCFSLKDLISHVEQFTVLSKRSKKGNIMAQRIREFCDRLTPYFDVIGIICGSNPDWANIAWGAFRLVLQLASNFATFFEKLCEFIRRCTILLPQYEEVLKSLEGEKQGVSLRLQDSMVRLYGDLFDFFQKIARVFSKPDSKLKSKPRVIAKLAFTPFDIYVQEALERFKFHQRVVRDELVFAKMGNLWTTFEAEAVRNEAARDEARRKRAETEGVWDSLEGQGKLNFDRCVLTWLAAPEFKEYLDEAQDVREEGTTKWLFEDAKFQAWRAALYSRASITVPPPSILWVQGNPGWGKTVLAASVIEELRFECPGNGDSPPLVCYYFFKQGATEKAGLKNAYRALVTQIYQQCHQLEAIRNIFALAVDGVDPTGMQASEQELRDLLNLCLPNLDRPCFVFDGIDECTDDGSLLRLLRHLTSSSDLRVILFSRPNVSSLYQSVSDSSTITLQKSILNEDIGAFLDGALADLRSSQKIPEESDIACLRDYLLHRADGMFLWARLMLNYLNSPALSRAQRVAEIAATTPEGLDTMYGRILRHIMSLDSASGKFARTLFTWMVHAKSDLGPSELKEIMWSETFDSCDDIDHAIIMCSGGLIEKRQGTKFQFVHLTARQFILSQDARWNDGSNLLPSRMESNSQLAVKCMSYISYSIPCRPFSGNIRCSLPADEMRLRFPFLEYAARYWPEHTAVVIQELSVCPAATGAKQLFDAVTKLLELRFNLMAWIEASHTISGYLPVAALGRLKDSCGTYLKSDVKLICQTTTALSQFITDMEDLAREWGETLQVQPHEIWNDVSSFTASRFLAMSSALNVRPVVDTSHGDNSGDPFFKSTRSCDLGNRTLLANLMVWAPREFKDCWNTSNPDEMTIKHPGEIHLSTSDKTARERSILEQPTCGWRARYEIFEVSHETVPIGQVTWGLDPNEVALVLRQSLRCSPLAHWKLRFPREISANLTLVVILRTTFLFDLERAGEDKCLKYSSALVPLDLPVDRSVLWSTRRGDFPASTYSYEWHPSLDNHHLVFRDFDPFGVTSRTPDSLIVFQVKRHSQGHDVARVGSLALNSTTISDWKIASYHSKPQLLFTLGTAIWLWSFGNAVPEATETALTRVYELPSVPDHLFSWSFDPIARLPTRLFEICNLGFSACGKYATISTPGAHHDHVITLPEAASLEKSQDMSATNNPLLNQKRCLKRSEPSDGGDETSSAIFRIPKIPRLVGATLTSCGEGGNQHNDDLSAVRVASAAHPNTINLMSLSSSRDSSKLEAQRSISLVRTPRSINLGNVDAAVIWPEEEEQRAQILLMEKTAASYESDEPTFQRKLPLILERDRRSLAVTTPKSETGLLGEQARHSQRPLPSLELPPIRTGEKTA